MASTYEAIATTTLSSASTTITFSSIPQTFTDLVLVLSITNTGSTVYRTMQFNSDTSTGSTNYSTTILYAEAGNSSGGDRQSNTYGIANNDGTDSGSNTNSMVAHIMNYTNTNTNKSVIVRSNKTTSPQNKVSINVGLWRSTAAINSVTMYSSVSNSYGTGTTATLYGIKAA